MAQTATPTRQWPLFATVDLGIANIGAGNEVTVKVPVNAYVHDINAVVVTPFNGTTNTVSASDGTTTFISAEDAKAAANTVIAVDARGKFFPSGGTITFSMAQTGAATAGRIVGGVLYSILGRGNEVQSV